GSAKAPRAVDFAGGSAVRVAAPRSDVDETALESARGQGGAGWHPVDRSPDRRAREGQVRQGGAWRVRERVPRLLRRPGHVLCRHPEGRRADLPADLHRHLCQSRLREASSTRSATTSQPRSLLSIARLNIAKSRVRPSICNRVRIDHTCFGRNGGFWPISLPLFQGCRRGSEGIACAWDCGSDGTKVPLMTAY